MIPPFATASFESVELSDVVVAGKGGSAISFSPTIERRMITSSSNGTTANAIYVEGKQDFRLFGPVPVDDELRDIDHSHDNKRVVVIDKQGRIVFLSNSHFINVNSFQSPVTTPSSLAIGDHDSFISIANVDGSLYFYQLKGARLTPDFETAVVVHHVAKSSDLFPNGSAIRAASTSYFQKNAISDRHGNLIDLFVLGGTNIHNINNKCFVLRKRENIWRFEQLMFDGVNRGPTINAEIHKNPAGEMIVLLRQPLRKAGPYAGRFLVLYENVEIDEEKLQLGQTEIWESECVIQISNAGFGGYPIFDEQTRVNEILHFDYNGLRFLNSKRPTNPTKGDWPTSLVAGRVGAKNSGGLDSNGTTHLLARRYQNRRNPLSSIEYLLRTKDGRFESSTGHGSMIFVNSRDEVIAWDDFQRRFYFKNDDHTWREGMSIPLATRRMVVPWLDKHDRFWLCENRGDEIEIFVVDGEKLFTGRIALGQEIPANQCHTKCVLTPDGRLQILLVRTGLNGFVTIVETVKPIVL